jgi:hypothetical protein
MRETQRNLKNPQLVKNSHKADSAFVGYNVDNFLAGLLALCFEFFLIINYFFYVILTIFRGGGGACVGKNDDWDRRLESSIIFYNQEKNNHVRADISV